MNRPITVSKKKLYFVMLAMNIVGDHHRIAVDPVPLEWSMHVLVNFLRMSRVEDLVQRTVRRLPLCNYSLPLLVDPPQCYIAL